MNVGRSSKWFSFVIVGALVCSESHGNQKNCPDAVALLATQSHLTVRRDELLNGSEVDAIKRITSYYDHETVNSKLRSRVPALLVPLTKVYEKKLNAALSKLPDHRGIVYRATTLLHSQYAKYAVGAITTEHGFTSTSTERDQALKFLTNGGPDAVSVLFLINSQSGKDVTAYSEFPWEREVLFKSGTRFKVREIRLETLPVLNPAGTQRLSSEVPVIFMSEWIDHD